MIELWLSLIAYNLGNLWRRLVLPARIHNWSLTSLQQRLVKTGGRAKARQNRPVEAMWRAFGLSTGLELWVCKPLGLVGV